MKATEFMVGDWVNIMIVGYDNPVQIKEIGKFWVKVTQDDKDYGVILVQPVLLTPEILEKIGFETQPNIGYIIDDWDGTQIIYDSWNHNLRIIKNYKVCLDIETFDDIAVHELQHALRLCGIEKEIEL